MRAPMSATQRRNIGNALRGKVKKAAGSIKKKLGTKVNKTPTQTMLPPPGGPKPMDLKANEGFTGYRTGVSTKKPTQSGAGKTSKGYGGQQSAKAMQDGMGGMTGYKSKSQQSKLSKQGEYTNNMKKFLGSK